MHDFEGDDIDDKFRQLLDKAQPVRWGLFHHQQTSTYVRDRVVLLGDSAHASLPFQAAGAAQGLEDALVLSSVLAEVVKTSEENSSSPNVMAAGLKAYDTVRRPRAQKQLEQSAEVADMMFFQGENGDNMQKILAKLQNGRFDWLWFHDIAEDTQAAVSTMRQPVDR